MKYIFYVERYKLNQNSGEYIRGGTSLHPSYKTAKNCADLWPNSSCVKRIKVEKEIHDNLKKRYCSEMFFAGVTNVENCIEKLKDTKVHKYHIGATNES